MNEVFLIEKEKKKVCQFIIAHTLAQRERELQGEIVLVTH
jgi:hypothetical protein